MAQRIRERDKLVLAERFSVRPGVALLTNERPQVWRISGDRTLRASPAWPRPVAPASPSPSHRLSSLGRSPIATPAPRHAISRSVPSAQPMNPTTHLAIVTEYDGQRSVLRLQGELDASNRDQLHSTISSALRSHPPLLVVDLSGLGFMDCAGLSVLVWARKRLAGCGHQLVITGAEPVVQRLLHLTGLDIYLCLSNTDEDIYT